MSDNNYDKRDQLAGRKPNQWTDAASWAAPTADDAETFDPVTKFSSTLSQADLGKSSE